ncbi:MAG TPA: hypothetical protein VF494_02745 [Candidatus Limnocylindrales bacterium]
MTGVPFILHGRPGVNELRETPIRAGSVEGAQTLSMILAGSLVAALAARLRPTAIITAALVGVAAICGLPSIVPNVLGLLFVADRGSETAALGAASGTDRTLASPG